MISRFYRFFLYIEKKADGHFAVTLSGVYKCDSLDKNKSITGTVRCAFSLNQSELNRINGESNIPFMTELAKFFQVNLLHKIEKSINFKGPDKKVMFFVQSDKKHYIIITYLNKYPLMSSKHLNFLSFKLASLYLGKRLSANEIKEIRLIKNTMNSKTTEFD